MTVYKFNISKLFTKISKPIFFILIFFASTTVFAQIDGNKKKILNPVSPLSNIRNLKNTSDSLRIQVQDTSKFAVKDSLKVPADSLSESTLKNNLTHSATDYTLVNNKKKFIKLYNNAHIHYEDIDLTAGVIYVDYAKKEVYAGRIPDSLGKLSQRPVFVQGSTTTENDSIRFNFETKKALVWSTYTKEGEIALFSEVSKKYNDSVMFVKNVRFTTSTDREHPEYYFLAKKGKIVPGKKVVVSSTQMWVEDVATPLFIPFAFFPITNTRTSGFVLPSFADSKYGYGLTEGGFYWAASPYLDFLFTTDIYTNGSYHLRMQSKYKKRYKFSGYFKFSYSNYIESEIGLPDYSKDVYWNIYWKHDKDGKSNPLSGIGGHVDFGSSRYYKDSQNYSDLININNRTRNELSSSITYQKRFTKLPMSFTASLNHNQQVSTKRIDLTLPQISLNVNRIYPFARNGKKTNPFQKINLTYNVRAVHKITTTDSLLFTNRLWEGSKMGLQHNIPITTDMKILKYFNLKPTLNFLQVVQAQTVKKYWDATANNGNGKEVVEEVKGLKQFVKVSATANLSTSLYGTYLFGDKHKIMGIRHTINPSLSYGYTPIFDQFIRSYYNSTRDTIIEYTPFDNGLYGTPNRNESKSVYMNMSQTFEMKVKTKDGKSKKIRLLTASNSYNFLADSLRMSDINLSSTAQLLKGVNVNLNASFDMYAVDDEGKNYDKLAVTQSQGLGHIRRFSISTGYNFSQDTFKPKKNDTKKDNKDKKEKDEAPDAYNNPISWTANVNYNFVYQNKAYSADPLYKEIGTHSVTFQGKINFSPSWKISYQSGYDLVNKGFTPTQFTFYRDLKSWQMSFTWSPNKNYSYWFFNISIKSSLLQGIKYDKRKEPFKKFF